MGGVRGRVRPGERGFSLIEILVVVAILGMMALVAIVAVGKTSKRQRSESGARQLQAFIESAWMRVNRAPSGVNSTPTGVFVVIPVTNTGTRVALLVKDTNNNQQLNSYPIDQLEVPDQLVLTSDVTVMPVGAAHSLTNWPTMTFKGQSCYVLLCDLRGRAVDATLTTPAPITTQMILSVTHTDMITTPPKLTPRLRYDLRVDRLWHVGSGVPVKW